MDGRNQLTALLVIVVLLLIICCCCLAAPFETTPSPLTVAVEQKVATFECQHLNSDGLTWLVNGTSLNRINSPNITSFSSGTMHSLSIETLLEYNGTTIQCVATFLDGSSPIPSPTVTLLIQDTPGGVKNATSERNSSSSLLTTRWLSLPSLDLNDTDPDIVYSVELYKITCGEDIFMSHEDVFVNSTNNTVDPMEIYKVIIIARNNVEGARNGTSVEMKEEFMTLNKASQFHIIQNPHFNAAAKTQVVPSYYTMILEPLDGHQEQNLMINISVERSGEMVNMSVDGEIPTKTLWNASLLAYGCQSDTVVKGVGLSTHDIQNISVTSPQPGEARVTGDFINGSTATGLLNIIYSLTNGSDVHYMYIEKGSISGLAGGEYSISVFVVEENGLPFERVTTSPKLVTVETNDVVTPPSSSIEYSLQSTSTGVCITCTFLDSSTTDCVAVVHQRISQLNSSGLINIKSYKLNRSGDTAFGCIEEVNMEDYQVGVFGWRQAPSTKDTEESGAASSCKGCIVGAVLGVLVFILLAVVVGIVTLIVVRKKMRTKLHVPYETSGSPTPPTSDDVNQPENEATVTSFYESITVTNRQESRTELDESADEALEPLLSTPSLSPPLPTSQGENRVYSDSSSDSAPSSQDNIETDFSLLSESNDDRISVDPGPLYDLPQLPGSTDVPPPTNIQHQSNEQESPPPVPLRTEDSKILVQESSNPLRNPQDKTSTNIQSPPDPTYAEPQMTGRAPVQTPPTEEQALHSPPPVPPITEDRGVLLQVSSESSPTQGSPHIAVLIDLPAPTYPTYAEPQPPAVNQPQSKEKQQMPPSGESCGPTYAQPVLSSGVTSPPPATEPVVYVDVKGFKNSEGQHYAMLGEFSQSKKVCTPDDSDQEKTVYSEIQPSSLVPTTAAVRVEPDTSSVKNKPTTDIDPSFTVEHIFPALLSMASKWQAVGMALSLDEDQLDEIFTNNVTDEACLHVMLELYMKRCGLKHSWEEIREAMRKVEEGDGETKGIDPSSQESLGKKPLDAEINNGRVTSEHGRPPAVPTHVPPHLPTGVESASHNNMTTSNSTTEASKHVEPHMTCGQPHNDSSDAVVDLEVDTELKENESKKKQQVQNNEEKEEEAAEKESGDNMNTVINKEDLRGTAEVEVSHTHTCTSSPCDFSPQPFDDNKDECKEHQFPLSCQETQHDEADYKTELMKILKLKPNKEKQNCQENKLSSSNPGQSTPHEPERALSLSESPSSSMVDSQQNTKLHSIFDQYGDIVKKISVHRQLL